MFINLSRFIFLVSFISSVPSCQEVSCINQIQKEFRIKSIPEELRTDEGDTIIAIFSGQNYTPPNYVISVWKSGGWREYSVNRMTNTSELVNEFEYPNTRYGSQYYDYRTYDLILDWSIDSIRTLEQKGIVDIPFGKTPLSVIRLVNSQGVIYQECFKCGLYLPDLGNVSK